MCVCCPCFASIIGYQWRLALHHAMCCDRCSIAQLCVEPSSHTTEGCNLVCIHVYVLLLCADGYFIGYGQVPQHFDGPGPGEAGRGRHLGVRARRRLAHVAKCALNAIMVAGMRPHLTFPCSLLVSWAVLCVCLRAQTLERNLELCAETAHPTFRCFISAEPPAFAYMKNVPESLMQSCIKVSNEAPADLRSNLTRSWAYFSQVCLIASV